jgi:hypothetical protein
MKGQIQRVKHEKASGHGFPEPHDFFEGLIGLKDTDDSGNGSQYSGLLATRNRARRRRFREEAAVTGPAGMGFEGAELAIEPQNRSGD